MNEEIRRQAWATRDAHASSLPKMEEALDRLFDPDNGFTEEEKSVVLGGLNPKSFYKVGGLMLAGATIIAACGSDSNDSGTTAAPATTAGGSATTAASSGTTAAGSATTMGGSAGTGDVSALRTASSLEELAVAVYQTAIDSGLVKTAAIADAAKLFQSQHKEHSQLFQGATTKAGGTPFDKPNPAVLAQLQPTIKALKDETGVVTLAHSLETAAAETYQKVVGTLKDLTLNQAFMSVGGTEARHAVILASVLKMSPLIPKAFQPVDQAVPVGTGV
jgi:rubrerythrin